MFELDSKDKSILFQLDTDARMSASQIGKKVKLPQEVVNYRIKKLEGAGVIKKYISVIQFFKLGYTVFKLFFQFQHLSDEKHKEMIEFFKKKKEVNWVAECNGRWDLMITFIVNDFSVFESIKNDFFAEYSEFIANKSMAIMTEYRPSPRHYLTGGKASGTSPFIVSSQKPPFVELSDADKKILDVVTIDARLPIIQIAQRTNLSPRVVDYHMNQLKKSGVLLGAKLSLDLEKIGYIFFKSFIYLENASAKRRGDLVNFCDEHPNIIHSVVVLGQWDFELEVEAQTNEEFYKIIDYIRDKFSDIVKTIETVVVSKEYNLTYFPRFR